MRDSRSDCVCRRQLSAYSVSDSLLRLVRNVGERAQEVAAPRKKTGHVPGLLTWLLIGLVAWTLLSVPIALYFGRFLRLSARVERAEPPALPGETTLRAPVPSRPTPLTLRTRPLEPPRILIVDDDAGLRMLLRTTLTADEFEVAEAEDAQRASELARFWRPKVVVLDVAMPGIDGLSFCSELKQRPALHGPAVVLLTGTDLPEEDAIRAGADALLRKPFSPLELVGIIDRLTGAEAVEVSNDLGDAANEQLLLYGRDLGRLLEIERMQRRVVQDAYRETVTALANALEAKDTLTGLHSLRVREYAVQLTAAIEPTLLSDPSLEYGFLLHDVGKIAMPNELLVKPGALSAEELGLIQQHTIIGAEILADVTFLRGEGLKVIRSHHERWDGAGYPDRLSERAIPLSARIFAVADAVDAMTGDRPYRNRASWEAASREVAAQSGQQFDPDIVEAFLRENAALRRIYDVTEKAA
jgi:response regulator RpfG family c-di-GMP phosphodiesterase